MDRIGHNDRLCDFHHKSSVAVNEFFCWSRNIWAIAMFLMSSRAHAGRVWSTRQPILLQYAVHSTCHNLARAKIFNSVSCKNQATKPAVWCNSDCSHTCFNERSRKSSIEGFTFVQRGLKFWKLTKTPLIYSISYFSLGGWKFCFRANHTKVTHGDETGSRAAQWWGRARDCSWNLWLKWIKANNKRRVTQSALKTRESADDE